MLIGLGLLVVSALALLGGAELFTENAGSAARQLGITVFGAAFLLAGAEPEEMITAVIASARHRAGLAAGDAIGANLTMLTLVVGLAALARPLPFGGKVRGYAVWSALAWAAMRRGVAEIAVAGVVGSVAYNATASVGAAALARPLVVSGILLPAAGAAVLPLALLAAAPRGRLGRGMGAVLVAAYAAWVAVVLH